MILVVQQMLLLMSYEFIKCLPEFEPNKSANALRKEKVVRDFTVFLDLTLGFFQYDTQPLH